MTPVMASAIVFVGGGIGSVLRHLSNRAGLALKIFAFVAYLLGMLLYLGEMLIETNVKAMVFRQLEALPHPSAIAQEYVGVTQSWLGYTTAVLFNGAFWILAIGIFYLLFFWKREPERA